MGEWEGLGRRRNSHNCDFTLPQNGDFPLPPRGFRPPLWPQLSAHQTAPICARRGRLPSPGADVGLRSCNGMQHATCREEHVA